MTRFPSRSKSEYESQRTNGLLSSTYVFKSADLLSLVSVEFSGRESLTSAERVTNPLQVNPQQKLVLFLTTS